jgi:hypothetical protein
MHPYALTLYSSTRQVMRQDAFRYSARAQAKGPVSDASNALQSASSEGPRARLALMLAGHWATDGWQSIPPTAVWWHIDRSPSARLSANLNGVGPGIVASLPVGFSTTKRI